jgi:cystathionine beta-lyase/cystathionine gamma-synthase
MAPVGGRHRRPSGRRVRAGGRAAAGIGEGAIRISVGLGHPDDLTDDLTQALPAAG